MPKRGGGQHASGSRFADLQDYYEHDDRKPNKDRSTIRRVSFKNTHNHQFKELKGRMAEMAIRSRLEDDDEMGDGATSSRFDERAGSRRKGSPIPKGKFGNFRKLLITNPFGWYQVTANNAQRYSKDEVLRALLSTISPDTFIAHYWRNEKNCAVFFVDDFNIANRLQQLDRGVQMYDGQRIFLRTRSNCPHVNVDETLKEKMKLAMADRYNAHTKTLDMSRFHAHPRFKDVFVGIFRANVMSTAVDIIVQNIPDLIGLYLNDNGLHSLDGLKNIPTRLPDLKILHLANNKIPSLAHILPLRNVPLTELNLENNPLRQRYKEKSLYVSEVRRKFPHLKKLDGETLTPEIKFELGDQHSMPDPKASYLCEPNAAGIIREFLETYFKLYDSDNRSPLMAAYHSEALWSSSVPPATQAGRLGKYWNHNRNLLRLETTNINESVVKFRMLKVGNLPIVAALTELPKTQHDLQTFSVDLTLYVEGKMMIFTVCGLFKELDPSAANGGEIRCFRRDFVVVPNGPGGFCIRNELCFITSATHIQTRSFQRIPNINTQQPTTSANAMAAAAAANSIQNRLQMQPNNPATVQIAQTMMPQATVTAPVPQIPTQLDDNTKFQMVQALCAHSNMNLEWSKKCLEETHWDYNSAIFTFDKLHKEHKIPAEAFIK